MPSSSAPSVGDASSSKTTIFAEMVTGSHLLEVKGYSGTKGIGVGKSINSGVFGVAGHRWFIKYCPDGFNEESANYISVLVRIDHPVPNAGVKARFCFSLLNHAGEPMSRYTFTSKIETFLTTTRGWGYDKFIERKVLESSYLKDDSFKIRCDVTVFKQIRVESTTIDSLTVPPPNLHLDLGDLLASEVGRDVIFQVGSATFAAHKYILAARSSVFKAELFGPMKEKSTDRVRIHDMEPRVFEAMLDFIYTDLLLEIDFGGEEERRIMHQHLLVAADRYNMERLKLICENVLCEYIRTDIAVTTLVLAEQHGCRGLKEACFKFFRRPGNLKAVMASGGIQHLKNSCPSLLEELLAMVA